MQQEKTIAHQKRVKNRVEVMAVVVEVVAGLTDLMDLVRVEKVTIQSTVNIMYLRRLISLFPTHIHTSQKVSLSTPHRQV